MKWFVKVSPLHNANKELKEVYLKTLDVGWGNGYVLIPPKHPWYAYSQHNLPVEVHGGLTFGSIVEEKTLELWEELDENDIGCYMIGFDTAHYRDTIKTWPKKAVITETLKLDRQVRLMSSGLEWKFID
jgi:hypothetical protein